jgi:hypothetical protein
LKNHGLQARGSNQRRFAGAGARVRGYRSWSPNSSLP